MYQRLAGPLAVLCLVVCSGCSGAEYDKISTNAVTGKVTINGVPATGATVRFHPDSPQTGADYPLLPSGKVNEEGVYQLTTYEGDDGAPAGGYTVTIEWPDRNWRPPNGGMPPPPPDRLQGAYADPKKSNIHMKVDEGANEMQPIVLKDVKILKGSSLN
ncbi:carboxypeptidase regulatory-like domain-containing protein [Gimesia sp.]|uniref:carboxypeptidase regulatory-like domain-containing protein n=1 Tax=Gimesia sp. TaxID=2024833 RepID=UPI003A8EBA2A